MKFVVFLSCSVGSLSVEGCLLPSSWVGCSLSYWIPVRSWNVFMLMVCMTPLEDEFFCQLRLKRCPLWSVLNYGNKAHDKLEQGDPEIILPLGIHCETVWRKTQPFIIFHYNQCSATAAMHRKSLHGRGTSWFFIKVTAGLMPAVT